MTSHDSRPTEGHSERGDATVDSNHERARPRTQGSPIPENVDELLEPQSRLTLKGDAYGAFGNDSDHDSAHVRRPGSTPEGEPPRNVPDDDPYGRDGQRDRHSGTGRNGPGDDISSDKRLRELICERLAHDHDVDISDVSIEVSAGCVTLKGTIPEHRMSAMIEDAVASIPGVEAVNNRIAVVFGGSGSGNEGA